MHCMYARAPVVRMYALSDLEYTQEVTADRAILSHAPVHLSAQPW